MLGEKFETNVVLRSAAGLVLCGWDFGKLFFLFCGIGGGGDGCASRDKGELLILYGEAVVREICCNSSSVRHSWKKDLTGGVKLQVLKRVTIGFL
jgi:hypothetical protein